MNTKAKENTVPLLDLAPRLNKPLSPWNPRDYLRLLYWIFFFPQALRWYLHRFGNPEYLEIRGSKVVEVMHRDPVQRRLVAQALTVLFIAPLVAALILSAIGVPVNWTVLAAGVTLGMLSGGLVGMVFGITFAVAFGATFGISGSVMLGAAFGAVGSLEFSMVLCLALGTGLGTAFGLALTAAGSLKNGVDNDTVKVVSGGMTFVMAGLVIFTAKLIMTLTTEGVATSILASNLNITAFFSIGLGAAFCAGISRLPDYLPLALAGTLYWYGNGKRRALNASRVVSIPLPGVQKQLENWLYSDWKTGLHNINQLLAYTLQFTPAVKAIDTALEHSPDDTLLSRVNALVDQPYDWDLIRFCSVSLKNQLWQKAIEGFFFLFPKRKKRQSKRFSLKPRVDTPARAACAGFWYWHREESENAKLAFARLKELRYGTELYDTAHAIHLGLLVDKKKDEIKGIADWEQKTRWLEDLSAPELRPGTLKILKKLRIVAHEVRTAATAKSPPKRSKIIIRSIETLNQIIAEEEKNCTQPEWPLIKEIAKKWQKILKDFRWIIKPIALRKPVDNPYEGNSGLPVIGVTFTGRDDIMGQIENYWSSNKSLKSLVLYGHRRMGKTSILRNLEGNTESNMLLVFLDMQNVRLVQHTGEFLMEFSEAIYKAADNACLSIGSPPKEEDYADVNTGRRALNGLLDQLAPYMIGKKRLVLAIDEFELIEELIEEKQIDAGILTYLRFLIQEYTWLGLIFAGLHKLEEMGRDYQSVFYGSAEYLRVGYLKQEDAVQLITQPHFQFALEYSPPLIDELYRLTYGQPYLLQCLCWKLVSRWNQRFCEEGVNTQRLLTLADLPPVLTLDFFNSADYYFSGVWSNVTENERALMRIMAEREKGTWTIEELAAAVKDHPSFAKSGTLEETIDLLLRHDVIVKEKNGYRFASELMRRWVAEESH